MKYLKIGSYVIHIEGIHGVFLNCTSEELEKKFPNHADHTFRVEIGYVNGRDVTLDCKSRDEAQAAFNKLSELLEAN